MKYERKAPPFADRYNEALRCSQDTKCLDVDARANL